MTAVGQKRPAVSRAKMERAAKALRQAGIPFQGFRLHPDGSVDVLAGDPLTVTVNRGLESIDQLDDELAQHRKAHGYS